VGELVLRRGMALRALPSPQRPGFNGAVTGLLREAAQRGPLAWGLMLTLLFERASPYLIVGQAVALASSTRIGTTLQAGLDRAVDEWLTRIAQSRLLQPGDEADGPALLTDRLSTMQQIAALRTMMNRPIREQRRVAALSQSLSAVNRALFERTLTSRLHRFEAAMRDAACGEADAGLLAALEEDMRSLRLFATNAARLEEDQDYSRLIEVASLRLATSAVNTTGAPVARRLIGVLGGSARALQIVASPQHQIPPQSSRPAGRDPYRCRVTRPSRRRNALGCADPSPPPRPPAGRTRRDGPRGRHAAGPIRHAADCLGNRRDGAQAQPSRGKRRATAVAGADSGRRPPARGAARARIRPAQPVGRARRVCRLLGGGRRLRRTLRA
jgi:hypothetical protein